MAKRALSFWDTGLAIALRDDPDAQLVALYVREASASIASRTFRCSVPRISHDTGLPTKEVVRALEALAALAILSFDEAGETISLAEPARSEPRPIHAAPAAVQ